MLGVVDHFFTVRFEIADRVGDQLQILFERNAQGAVEMQVPGLADSGRGLGSGVHWSQRVGSALDRIAGEARRAERGELSVLELEIAGANEELLVLGIGAGP